MPLHIGGSAKLSALTGAVRKATGCMGTILEHGVLLLRFLR